MNQYSLQDDWRADGVRWKNNGRKINSRKTYEKRYYILDLKNSYDSGFKRAVFNEINNSSLKLVHYTGDHNLVVPFAHGNSKHQDVYCMTKRSTIDQLRVACKSKNAHIV